MRLAIVCSAALAASCGGEASPKTVVAGSGDATAEADRFRMAMTYDWGVDTVAEEVKLDYEHGSGIVAPREGLHPQVLVTPNALYVRLTRRPGVDPAKLRPRKWVKVDAKLSSLSPFEAQLVEPFVASPDQLFIVLRGVVDATKIGEGTERGARVTRYEAKIDVERALAQFPEDQRDEQREIFRSRWPNFESEQISIRLAIDSEERLRRVDFDAAGYRRITIEFFDLGIDVNVKPPRRGEVMSYEEFLD